MSDGFDDEYIANMIARGCAGSSATEHSSVGNSSNSTTKRGCGGDNGKWVINENNHSIIQPPGDINKQFLQTTIQSTIGHNRREEIRGCWREYDLQERQRRKRRRHDRYTKYEESAEKGEEKVTIGSNSVSTSSMSDMIDERTYWAELKAKRVLGLAQSTVNKSGVPREGVYNEDACEDDDDNSNSFSSSSSSSDDSRSRKNRKRDERKKREKKEKKVRKEKKQIKHKKHKKQKKENNGKKETREMRGALSLTTVSTHSFYSTQRPLAFSLPPPESSNLASKGATSESLSTNTGWKPRCGICTFPKIRCKCK